MKLSQLRKAYLMDLASRFTGPFHKKKAASFRTDAVKPTAPASKIPHDVYGELAFRFWKPGRKKRNKSSDLPFWAARCRQKFPLSMN